MSQNEFENNYEREKSRIAGFLSERQSLQDKNSKMPQPDKETIRAIFETPQVELLLINIRSRLTEMINTYNPAQVEGLIEFVNEINQDCNELDYQKEVKGALEKLEKIERQVTQNEEKLESFYSKKKSNS